MEVKIIDTGEFYRPYDGYKFIFDVKFYENAIENTSKSIPVIKDYDYSTIHGITKDIYYKEDGLYAEIEIKKEDEILFDCYSRLAPEYTEKDGKIKLRSVSFVNESIFDKE